MMYKKILVPTDGSEFAKKAQKQALFLANVCGAEIIAISVTENNLVSGLPLDDEVYQLNQILKERSEENLEEFDKLNKNDLNIIKNIINLILKRQANVIDEEYKYYFMSIARSYLFRMNDQQIFKCIKENKYILWNILLTIYFKGYII